MSALLTNEGTPLAGSWERTDGSKMMSKMIEKKTRGVTTARAQKFRQAMYDAMGEKGDEIMRPEVQELDQVGC